MVDYLKILAIDEAVKRGLDNSFKIPENYDWLYLTSFLICNAIREAQRRGRELSFKVSDVKD